MDQPGIALIAGLGNPGSRYASTRHNAGLWFIERLQKEYPVNFSLERKFDAEVAQLRHGERVVRVVVPNTFMNDSGRCIAPLAAFYRIEPSGILIVHDELDLAPGAARLKLGGGHGGHNGLRDIISRLGSGDFPRLRIGIGHPGPGRDVSGYVLNKPGVHEEQDITDAIDRAIAVLPGMIDGDYTGAMNALHPGAAGKQAPA